MPDGETARFLKLVVPGARIVLTTHVHPDGDGVGSELGLARFLRDRGVAARIVNCDPPPMSMAGLDPDGLIEVYQPAVHDAVVGEAHAVVSIDNSDVARLGAMAAVVSSAPGIKACIDHHPDPDPLWGLRIVDPRASCTGVVVLGVLDAAGYEPPRDVAEALYIALFSDTGRFRFGNTNAEGFRAAARLVEAGVSPAEVYARLSERRSAGFLRLAGAILAGMEVRAQGRVVLLRVPQALLDRFGAKAEDLSDVINQALKLESARGAALFREIEPAKTKISLRSKGALDVNQIARRHGGGGHRNASGVVLEMAMEDAIAEIAPALEDLVAE